MPFTRKYTAHVHDNEEIAVLFEGAKQFWKSRSNLDIIIINHKKSACLEVVCYNSDIHVESPRIYLNNTLLQKKLDLEEIKEKLSIKKEALVRQKKIVDEAALTAEIKEELTLHYILSRIFILNETKDVPFSESNPAVVVMKPVGTDTIVDATGKIDVVFDIPPVAVNAVEFNFQKKTTSEDFHTAMRDLKRESKALTDATTFAEVCLSSEEEIKALLAERMRQHLENLRTYSVPRKRWIKAINWVLTQNYVAIIRRRCRELYPGAPGIDPELTEEEKKTEEQAAAVAAAAAGLTGSGKLSLSEFKKSKKLSRRSFDNMLTEKRLSANALGQSESMNSLSATPQRGMLSQRRSSKGISNPLPPLDEQSPSAIDKRRLERRRQRRTFGDETSEKLTIHDAHASPAPSIRQSYAVHGEKAQPALPLEAIPPKKYLSFGQQALLNAGQSGKAGSSIKAAPAQVS